VQYRIGEFSKLSGISIKTLRFYDQIGLLAPAAVDTRTQYRLYVPRQLQDLWAIRALKELGASLSEIRVVTASNTARHERRKLLDKLRRNAERSLAMTRRSLVWIDSALQELGDDAREVPVALKQRSAVRVASVRAHAKSYAEIGELERDLRAVVPTHTRSLQGVLWHRCAASGAIEGEPFVEVRQRASRCGAYELSELPSATVATAYCEPDDRDAERVYDALSRWVHLHDYRLDGPKREIYVGQILEIQFPVKPA
jgi:DNA-binding transcriptional MerR regulator